MSDNGLLPPLHTPHLSAQSTVDRPLGYNIGSAGVSHPLGGSGGEEPANTEEAVTGGFLEGGHSLNMEA